MDDLFFLNNLIIIILLMKVFTVDNTKFRIKNEENKNEIIEDNSTYKPSDEETIPDEEFYKNKKFRNKIQSCPTIEQRGPNINLKIHQKRYSNQKEKEFFFKKIKIKKKTELCKNYEFYHDCYYKDDCSFAHGIEELRENINLSNYKTKMCISFQNNNFCNFGKRCSYRHDIK